MSWTWTHPPPVVVLSGTVEFLRIRELKKAIGAADRTKRQVQYVEGADRDELSSILSSTLSSTLSIRICSVNHVLVLCILNKDHAEA